MRDRILNAIIENYQLNPKSTESEEDANLRRFTHKCILIATLVALTVVCTVCIAIMIFLESTSIHFSVALQAVISLAMGLAGYSTRGVTLKKLH